MPTYEAYRGVEGPCLVRVDSDGSGNGLRIFGPKPWGGTCGMLIKFRSRSDNAAIKRFTEWMATDVD